MPVGDPTEEMLAARRVRAAELALDAARRRIHEADAEMRELRRDVVELTRQLHTSVEARTADARAAEARNARLRHALRLAEQRAFAERRDDRSSPGTIAPAPEVRVLEAEQEVRRLRGELELVIRQAAEFEQRVRLQIAGVERAARRSGRRPEPPPERPVEPAPARLAEPRDSHVEPPDHRSVGPEQTRPGGPTEPRFADALSRLRASHPPRQ